MEVKFDKWSEKLRDILRDNPQGLFFRDLCRKVNESPDTSVSENTAIKYRKELEHRGELIWREVTDEKTRWRPQRLYRLRDTQSPSEPLTFEHTPTLLIEKILIQVQRRKRRTQVRTAWVKDMVNQSPISQANYSTFVSNAVPHTWEELNPRMYIIRGGSKQEVDARSLEFSVWASKDNPFRREFKVPFGSNYLYQGDRLTLICEYTFKTEKGTSILLSDTGIPKVVFDLLIEKEEKPSLEAFSVNRNTGRREHIDVKSREMEVATVLMGQRSLALHWERYREKPDLEEHILFEWT